MQISPSYILMSSRKKREKILYFAMKDQFFDALMHDLNDYGHDIRFSITGGAGAYKPYALATERLDTPEKQHQFSHGFWKMAESGAMKAQIQLSLLLGEGGNTHSFLHEAMHFYQDMHGLYLVPLKEEGVFPIVIDAKSNIVSILFCEAWAEVESIRVCWALNQKGDNMGWRGAINSPDWKELARSYDSDLQNGVDEAKAAADLFRRWYQGKHRIFYEKHALDIHDVNCHRFIEDVEDLSDADIAQSLRSLELADLIARLPANDVPKYFSQIDWGDDLFCQLRNADVIKQLNILAQKYGEDHSTDIQDVRCGSPPYIWKRLRDSEVSSSEVPPH